MKTRHIVIISNKDGWRDSRNRGRIIICCKFMIEDIFVINGYKRNGKEVSSTIRGVYGQCGGGCVFLNTGHGITGVIEVYD